jgi:hypothetical protein
LKGEILYITVKRENQIDIAKQVALLLHILQDPVSNFSPKTGYAECLHGLP